MDTDALIVVPLFDGMRWVAPKDHCPWDAGFSQPAINKCSTTAAVFRIKSTIAPANSTNFKPYSGS